MTEELEALGINTERPKPARRHAGSAHGRAAAVGRVLANAGIKPRKKSDAQTQGVWVFAFLPHTARVEVHIRRADVRAAVLLRVRDALEARGYDTSLAIHAGLHVVYATKDAPDPRGQGRKTRGDL